MRVELRQKIERTIACKAIKGLLADGFKISVFDGEQTTLKHSTDTAVVETAMFTTDEDQLHVEHQHAAEKDWVLFIYGDDGHDVAAGRTTNLGLSFKGTSELADKIADEGPTTLAHVLTKVGA